MPLYETVCVIKPEVQGEAVEKIVGKIQRVLTENKVGEVSKTDWGLRKLAYPIANHKTAHYLQFVYNGVSDVVAQLERQLNYEDTILRYLTVKVENGVNPNAKPDSFNFGSRAEEDSFAPRRSYGRDRGDRDGGGRRHFRKHDGEDTHESPSRASTED